MEKVIDFLRKIGLLRVSSGDHVTGEFDNRKNVKIVDERKQETKVNVETKKVSVEQKGSGIF